jgi:hypothetical protein
MQYDKYAHTHTHTHTHTYLCQRLDHLLVVIDTEMRVRVSPLPLRDGSRVERAQRRKVKCRKHPGCDVYVLRVRVCVCICASAYKYLSMHSTRAHTRTCSAVVYSQAWHIDLNPLD